MKLYVISYDLRKQRNYQALYEAIDSYPYHAHVLESVWVVGSRRSAMEICTHLLKHVDRDDGVFVVRTTSEAAWHNVLCDSAGLKRLMEGAPALS